MRNCCAVLANISGGHPSRHSLAAIQQSELYGLVKFPPVVGVECLAPVIPHFFVEQRIAREGEIAESSRAVRRGTAKPTAGRVGPYLDQPARELASAAHAGTNFANVAPDSQGVVFLEESEADSGREGSFQSGGVGEIHTVADSFGPKRQDRCVAGR
jgi:hypothetical protein